MHVMQLLTHRVKWVMLEISCVQGRSCYFPKGELGLLQLK